MNQTEGAPLRIIHMLSSGRWTGAAEPAATLAAEQARLGHHVSFACIGGSSCERQVRERGLHYLEGFHLDRRLNLRHLVGDIAHLRQLVQTNRPDIVHCHLPHDHWLAALTLRRPFIGNRGKLGERPAIVRTVHREAPGRRDPVHRWLVGKASDMLIVVSRSQRAEFIERVGLPPSRIAWVRGVVDLERFHTGIDPLPPREVFGIPPEARVAGMVARMQRHRGHHLFIDTIEEVAAAEPLALYFMAGRGEIKNDLVARIGQHRLRHHLRRVGYRKHDLPETYAAMDVVCLLAPGSDGSCRAMLEAMACGRPVIGSRVGAIADTIEDGKTGWLVRRGDRSDLARALIEALRLPDGARSMGEAARRRVEQHHNTEDQCRVTMEVYAEALARRR